jgi:RNA polymerase sigma-70 factor (ECF subfamily)
MRWVSRLGGPSIDAEDAVQEVFLKVHLLAPSFRPDRARTTTWLYRITENVVRHRRRKERWRRWLLGDASDVASRTASPALAADELLARGQTHARFYRVLDGMNERYRTVLILFELEGHSGEELAELLGAKTATVWVWLHRARADFLKRLQRVIEEEDPS